MELPGHGQPASAGDDGRLRRFPDPPPPPHARDADALQRDAALVRRRDELLWELNKEQIRLDKILRELVETEYAMAAGRWPVPTMPWSQDRWHRRASSVTTWEDAPHRPPRPPPVYPHVERSPSPISASGYLEYRRSPSKLTLTKEALGPAMANASVRPMGFAFVRQEVTPEHKNAVGGERKADLEGDGVQPLFKSINQSSGQGNVAETTLVDWLNKPGRHSCWDRPAGQENAAFEQQKRLEFSEPWPGRDARQQQECRSSGATEHRMSGYLELCPSPSKRTPVDETLVPAIANTIIRPTLSLSFNEEKRIDFSESTPERTSSALKRRLSAATPLPKKQKPLEESSCTVNPTRQRNLDEYPAGQLHQSNVEALQARIKPAELVRWEGKENVAENRGSEDRPEPAASRWTCRICSANCTCASNLQEHLGGRRHRENTEAILAEFRSSYCRMDADSGKSVLLRGLQRALHWRYGNGVAPHREEAPGDAPGTRVRRARPRHDAVHGVAVRQDRE